MSECGLDVLLCQKVWGPDYAEHSEYKGYLGAIQNGRSASAINNDLRERIRFQKPVAKLPSRPEPHQQRR